MRHEHGLDPGAERFEVRVTADSHFAWLRTRLSVERTMMSWMRTAVSLIGFGFAIVQFFERMQQMPGIKSARFPDAAEVSRAGAHRLRHPGLRHLDLAVLVDASLPLAQRSFAQVAGHERRDCNRR